MSDNTIHRIDSHVRRFSLKEVLAYKELILMFTRRNFLLSYSQTILGPLWLFLNPLVSSLIYYFVFGQVANLSSDGLPKILFYLCGSSLWAFFSNCLNNNSRVFLDNNAIYSKVYFPRIIIPLSNILSSLIRYACALIPFVILQVYYLIKGSIHLNLLHFLWIPVVLLLLAVIGLSLGLLSSSVSVKYRDLNVVFQLAVSLWMYLTPVVYPLSITDNGLIRTLLLINPLTILFEMDRYVMLGVGTVSYGYLFYALLIAVLLLVLSLKIFYKTEKDFVDIV